MLVINKKKRCDKFTKKIPLVQREREKKQSKCVKRRQNKHTKMLFFQDRGEEERNQIGGGGVDGKIYRRHFWLLCLEYVITVHRQRPNLSSPDCLQTLHRQKPELSSTERTGLAKTRLLASHLKAAEKPWTRGWGGCSHWSQEGDGDVRCGREGGINCWGWLFVCFLAVLKRLKLA